MRLVGHLKSAAFSYGTERRVLLLHGFPQTKEMWEEAAPALARRFTVVTADLRGYGASSKPEGVEAMSFRNMAADQLALVRALGFALVVSTLLSIGDRLRALWSARRNAGR